MRLYFLQRILYLLGTLFVLSQLSFLIYYQSSTTPALSFFHTYWQFYQHLFTLQWGNTALHSQKIVQQWLISFSATFELYILTTLVSLSIGLPLGMISGLTSNRRYTNAIQLFYFVAITTPTLWISLFMVGLLNHYFQLLPIFSFYTAQNSHNDFIEFRLFNFWHVLHNGSSQQVFMLLKRLILTIGILILVPTAQIMQLSRLNTQRLIRQNYIQAAMIRGNNRLMLIKKHLLRNLIPILLPRCYLIAPLVLTLCLSIEAVYGWPGMGSWALTAYYQKNYFIIALITLTLGCLMAFTYLVCEILQFKLRLKNIEVPDVI